MIKRFYLYLITIRRLIWKLMGPVDWTKDCPICQKKLLSYRPKLCPKHSLEIMRTYDIS